MADTNKSKINPWSISFKLAKTNFERVLVNVLNAVSNDMYLGKVEQATKDIISNKQEASDGLNTEKKERVISEDEMLELIIALCDDDANITKVPSNGELTPKQKIKCKAIAKMILNGSYGDISGDNLQRVLNEVKGEYNLTDDMVAYIKELVTTPNTPGGKEDGSN